MKIKHVEGLSEFNRLEKGLESVYRNYAAAHNISLSVLQILYSIYIVDGKITQTEIGNDWSVPLQTINSSLNKMKKAGLLRLVCDEKNRRKKRICLTEAGEKLAEELIAPLVRAENESFMMLSIQEQETLLALTQKQFDFMKDRIAALNN